MIEAFKFWIRIMGMRIAGADDTQIHLEKGAYHLKKGAIYQVGQPIKTPIPGTTKVNTRYIKNLYYNFASNKITANFSTKPIAGVTENFYETKKAKATA